MDNIPQDVKDKIEVYIRNLGSEITFKDLVEYGYQLASSQLKQKESEIEGLKKENAELKKQLKDLDYDKGGFRHSSNDEYSV